MPAPAITAIAVTIQGKVADNVTALTANGASVPIGADHSYSVEIQATVDNSVVLTTTMLDGSQLVRTVLLKPTLPVTAAG